MLDLIKQKVLNKNTLTKDEISYLILTKELDLLLDCAHEITQKMAAHKFDSCSIINAKSGLCSEDCKWCAQSKHYATAIETYPLVDKDTCLNAALHCQKKQVGRFSLVTSGRKPTVNEFDEILTLISYLKLNSKIDLCVSLGLLNLKQLQKLREAGITRYHCNLESSENYFKTLCSSHTYAQKIATLKAAIEAGLDVCSGGIIGMGETLQDRVDLALTLRDLKVNSVPINILSPIPGTPLENMHPLSFDEILKTIAIFRFILPTAYLRFAGGRSCLDEPTLKKALYAGVNAAIVGDLLTTLGSDIDTDKRRFQEAGYEL